MNKLIMFFLLALFFSCTSHEKSYMASFPRTDSLFLMRLESIPSDLLSNPRDIFVVDDYFVIRDEIDGNWFSLIRRSDGKLIRHFGMRGRGPEEILYPLNQAPLNGGFYIYDSSKEIVHLFSLDSLLQGKNGMKKSIHLQFRTDKYAKCRQVIFLDSGNILANCCHPDGRVVMFDSNGYEQKVFCPDYPIDELHKEENYITKSFAFQYTGIAGGNNYFYNISTTAGHIEVFHLENNDLYQIVDNLYYLPKYTDSSTKQDYRVTFTKENKGGLFNPEISGDCLYAAYANQKAEAHTYIAYDVLFLFDLEGNPECCYYLSSRISRFFIEKESHTLYAIGADPETLEPCILYAKLK